MFRDGHFKKKLPMNIIFNNDGMGDAVARMTAVKYITEMYKHVEIQLIVPDYFQELAQNLVPSITVKKFSDGSQHLFNGNHSLQTKNTHTTLRTHLIDHAFSVLVDKQVEDKYKNYCKLTEVDVSKFSLPEKFVVITTGFTAEVRELLPEAINNISSYVKSKGYEVVFLGSKASPSGLTNEKFLIGNFKTEVDYSVGLDLINKTSLTEAGSIIAKAKAIVGTDNGLLHLAGCTNTAIIAGYTTVESKYRLPYRNNQLGWNCFVVEPEKSLKCRFCQSNWNFMPSENFTKCYYKENKLDTEIKCVKMLDSKKFVTELSKVL